MTSEGEPVEGQDLGVNFSPPVSCLIIIPHSKKELHQHTSDFGHIPLPWVLFLSYNHEIEQDHWFLSWDL